jgi:hypothetical protein
MVPCSRCRAPFLFQVIQERLDQRNVDLFEAKSFQRDSLNVAAKPEKESEDITVCFDGIGAYIPLRGQVVRQKGLHVNSSKGGSNLRKTCQCVVLGRPDLK